MNGNLDKFPYLLGDCGMGRQKTYPYAKDLLIFLGFFSFKSLPGYTLTLSVSG
jgi:hypothetical protein